MRTSIEQHIDYQPHQELKPQEAEFSKLESIFRSSSDLYKLTHLLIAKYPEPALRAELLQIISVNSVIYDPYLENLVAVQINRIKKAIVKNSLPFEIKSSSGKGYYLINSNNPSENELVWWLHLTQMQIKFLLLLLQNRSGISKRDVLIVLKDLKDSEEIITSYEYNILDIHVSRLRKYLEKRSIGTITNKSSITTFISSPDVDPDQLEQDLTSVLSKISI